MKPKTTIRNPKPYVGLYTHPWKCGECGKTLSRLDALCLHSRTVHGAEYTRLDREKLVGHPTQEPPKEKKA